MALSTLLNVHANTLPEISVQGLQQGSASTLAPSVTLPTPGADHSAELTRLLASPVDAKAAVRIALLNNPGLQVMLGMEGLSISDQFGADAPAKLKAHKEITQLSANTHKAWISAVAAAESVKALQAARLAAENSGELARRLARVGNWSRLQQARQQVLLAEAAADLARAQDSAFAAREKLIVLMGLWGPEANFALPDALPALPEAPRDLPDIEQRSLQARADLNIARMQLQRKEAERHVKRPADLWGSMEDSAALRGMAVQARSDARLSYQRYRSRYDLARHHKKELQPLREFINDEMVLRYNGMLSSVFDLLADTKLKAQAANAEVEARRDFWLADTDLQTLLAGVAPTFADDAGKAASAASASPAH
jgi:outer membrane protein TolC